MTDAVRTTRARERRDEDETTSTSTVKIAHGPERHSARRQAPRSTPEQAREWRLTSITARSCSTRSSRRSDRCRPVSSSTRRSAVGDTARGSSKPPGRARARSRPRSGGAGRGERAAGQVRGPVLHPPMSIRRPRERDGSLRPRPTQWRPVRPRCLLTPARPPRAWLLVPSRRSARHADGPRRPWSANDVVNGYSEAELRRGDPQVRRRALRVADRPRHRRRPPDRDDDASWPRS